MGEKRPLMLGAVVAGVAFALGGLAHDVLEKAGDLLAEVEPR